MLISADVRALRSSWGGLGRDWGLLEEAWMPWLVSCLDCWEGLGAAQALLVCPTRVHEHACVPPEAPSQKKPNYHAVPPIPVELRPWWRFRSRYRNEMETALTP